VNSTDYVSCGQSMYKKMISEGNHRSGKILSISHKASRQAMTVARKRSHADQSPRVTNKRSKEIDLLASDSPAGVPIAVKTQRWRNPSKVRRKLKSISGVTRSDITEVSARRDLPGRTTWSIVSQSGGTFQPKTLFSNDEK
jgi:hypothetical protein